jgi:hypothetical protein
MPLVGLVLGLVGLRQIRRRGQQGRGLAIAGVVISGVVTAITVLLIVLGAVGALDDGNTPVENITVGQCFNTVGSSLSDYDGNGARSTTVDVMPCEIEHDAEAYAVFTLDPGPGGGYPGVGQISDTADARCRSLAEDYLGGAPIPDTVEIYYFMPPKDGWGGGDHSVTCFFGDTSGPLTGSVKTGADASGVGV